MKSNRFPQFLFNDSKNPDSVGPLIFHFNFPRCIFKVNSGLIHLHHLIDKADDEKIEKITEAAKQWFKKQFPHDSGVKMDFCYLDEAKDVFPNWRHEAKNIKELAEIYSDEVKEKIEKLKSGQILVNEKECWRIEYMGNEKYSFSSTKNYFRSAIWGNKDLIQFFYAKNELI